MNIIRIDDPDDLRVAAYRDIRERDLAGRDNLFIAEGKVVLNVLFAAGRFEPDSVLVLEKRLPLLTQTLAGAPSAMPVYVTSGDVMDRISGFHVHRGILAAGRRRSMDTLGDLLAKDGSSLVLALNAIANHDNMGSIFRNAAAFGADAVLMDSRCCDPLYRKAIRVSVGATLKVPFAAGGSIGELADALAGAGYQVMALSPSGETDLREITPAPRTALLLGTEGEGLPAEVLRRLTAVRIAMRGDFDSLNVAAASAVALHHLYRDPDSDRFG